MHQSVLERIWARVDHDDCVEALLAHACKHSPPNESEDPR